MGSENVKEKEIRVRIDREILNKLKEHKKELDSKSYADTLRKILND